jgi:hypothetical protein
MTLPCWRERCKIRVWEQHPYQEVGRGVVPTPLSKASQTTQKEPFFEHPPCWTTVEERKEGK